jgi:hypothetical protein
MPPTHVADVSVAAWIAPRLASFGSCIGALVPSPFQAYARLRDRDPEPVWENGLSAAALAALVEIVSGVRGEDRCYFALWEGYGWIQGGGASIVVGTSEPPDEEAISAVRAASTAPAFGREILKGPKLRLRHRDYVLFDGPLASVLSFGRREEILGREVLRHHAPDFIWPDDHAWFIATDVDLDVAYIGGSRALIEDVISDERLVATRVTAEDPLLEEPDRLKHIGGDELSDLPPGHSLLITGIERDYRGIRIDFEIVPPIASRPVALHAEVRDDERREYDASRWEHGVSYEPRRAHGALKLPLPEPAATVLNVRLWWGGYVRQGAQRPEHRLRITL